MFILRALLAAIALSILTAAQQLTTFSTDDGGMISAELYGKGTRGVVLAHGGRFTKESWRGQARVLATRGFHVLAFDFRGFGGSRGPGQVDFDTAPFGSAHAQFLFQTDQRARVTKEILRFLLAP